jgi:hypothetical protein
MTREEAEAFLASLTNPGWGGYRDTVVVATETIRCRGDWWSDYAEDRVTNDLKVFVHVDPEWTLRHHRRSDVEAVCVQIHEHVHKVCEALIAIAEHPRDGRGHLIGRGSPNRRRNSP